MSVPVIFNEALNVSHCSVLDPPMLEKARAVEKYQSFTWESVESPATDSEKDQTKRPFLDPLYPVQAIQSTPPTCPTCTIRELAARYATSSYLGALPG